MSVANLSRRTPRAFTWPAVGAFVAILVGFAAWHFRDRWLPAVRAWRGETAVAAPEEPAEHLHASASTNAIDVSEKGLKNIGFKPETVSLQSFERAVTIPAIVVEQAGKTQIRVTAPFTGVLTKINIGAGEAVEPNRSLFEVRLTHEELVTAQQDFLKTAENLDVANRRLTRSQSLGENLVPGKRILAEEYEQQKLTTALNAGEQALLLHGLDEDQVEQVLNTRKLLRTMTVRAPAELHGESRPTDHSFHVQNLPVTLGQQIEAGQELCVLADHCELYIEGLTSQDDMQRLRKAASERWNISAKLLTPGSETVSVDNLKLLYLGDRIDPDSRLFRFYLQLPNEVALRQKTSDGREFLEWRFKPGQRMELRVPVEQWDKRIVLPVEAVVEEGVERFVYRQNGKRFERVPVHVEYRDGQSAVIANDGALFPGDVVAGRGAYQIHLAIKNKSGGAPDPHAGHNH